MWWERKWWEQPTTPTSPKQVCTCFSRYCCIRRILRALRAFCWVFHRYLVSLMVNKTNWYADQYLLVNAEKGNSHLHKWEDTNVPEIKTFLGVLLLMGVICKPQLPLYWSKDALYNTSIFSEVMSRNQCFYWNFSTSITMKKKTIMPMMRIKITFTSSSHW